MGHSPTSKAYRVWSCEKRRIEESRDVVFNEANISMTYEERSTWSIDKLLDSDDEDTMGDAANVKLVGIKRHDIVEAVAAGGVAANEVVPGLIV